MKEIISYLEKLCEDYNQMCQRKDGSIYGIEDGLNCRQGSTVYRNDLEDRRPKVDKLVLKAQGKAIRQLLERKVKEKSASTLALTYKDYFEIGKRKYDRELSEAKNLIRQVRRDRKYLDSLAKSGKESIDNGELEATTRRYQDNKEKVEKIFSRIRSNLLSQGDSEGAKFKASQVINNSPSDYLPRSKDFYREALGDLYRISKNRVTSLGQLLFVRKRAFARKPKGNEVGKINVGKQETEKDSRASLWHEFGHHIEISNPELKGVFKEWILSRSSGKTVSLRQLTGNQKYGKDEVAYDGKFGLGAYVGRVYPDGGTEVMSKGLEMFSSEKAMASFFSKDPEHFLMILGILDSL